MLDFSLRLALSAGIAAVLGGAVLAFGHHERDVGRSEVRAQVMRETSRRQDVVIQRQSSVLAINQAQAVKAKEVETDVQNKLAAVSADRDRARTAVAGLRDELDRVRADALSGVSTHSQLVAQVSAATNSLSECSGRYTAVAGERDELAVQVAGLLPLLPAQ
ncbi:MAG: hypothetical protein EPO09_14835 [Aquabacterium sp.]|uniref:hypothetical protein n=1 Tax=Aquabacterium sp. TaxID=1872578 RepID=UPI00121F3638|nr:hypothetical protein [Aquabacterium sp.]TAK92746.1 MAG: hypothetical protein EPO09_14835 [Aquabacterium sp.]